MGTSSLWLVPPADTTSSVATAQIPGASAALDGGRTAGRGRVPAQTRRTAAGTPRQPAARVLVLGAAGARVRDVGLALLDTEEPGIAGMAPGPAWTVFGYGATTVVRSYVPGQRRPRTVPIEAFAAGAPPPGATDKGRPPRRIEIDCPSEVLPGISLVLAPELGADGGAGADLAMDAVDRSDAVVFVVGAAPLGNAQIEVLRHILATPIPLALVFSAEATPTGVTGEAALEGCRLGLVVQEPELERAPWFWMDGAEGPSIGQLRRAVAGVAAAGWPGAARPTDTAPAVPSQEPDWRAALDAEIDARRTRAGQRMSIELATLHVRCVQELGSGAGAAAVPGVLDLELQALAVRAARALDRDVAEILRAVGAVLLGSPVDASGFARLATAVRRAVVDSCDPPQSPHALLLTMTAGVATVTGKAAADSLCALGMADPGQPRHTERADPAMVGSVAAVEREVAEPQDAQRFRMADSLFWPMGIALAGSCYQLWHDGGSEQHARCQGWVQQAIWGAERELLRESGERYALLAQAVAIVAEDAVEHGFLLL